jgi:hypothetical protein
MPKIAARALFLRNSKDDEIKQQTMLTRHIAAKNIAGGYPWLKNENVPINKTDGTNAKGSASTKNFFFLSGSLG